MKIYAVGGSLRNKFLGIPVNDQDYVITNAPKGLFPEETKVGKDAEVYLVHYKVLEKLFKHIFPSGIHEVRLARAEVSTGPGYNDFTYTTDGITIEQDLACRDLTINTMAQEIGQYNILDLYKGVQDLQDKVLRHATPAFSEDPLRILRLARFRATLPGTWTIAHETKVLAYKMRWQLGALAPERIWKELEKVLAANALASFMETLYELRVLDVIFPEIHEMVNCREGSKHHREANVFVHTMMMLRVEKWNTRTQLAILFHDVAKPICYTTYGASKGHDNADIVEPLLPCWIPTKLRRQVLFLIGNHTRIYKTSLMSAQNTGDFLMEYKREPQLLEDQLSVATADDLGREVDEGIRKDIEYTQIREAYAEICAYSPSQWIRQTTENYGRPSVPAIQQHIHRINMGIVKKHFKKD